VRVEFIPNCDYFDFGTFRGSSDVNNIRSNSPPLKNINSKIRTLAAFEEGNEKHGNQQDRFVMLV
jgi:hypothetical protein